MPIAKKKKVVAVKKKTTSEKTVAKVAKAVATAEDGERIVGTLDQRAEANNRAAACNTEIGKVLKRFNCRIGFKTWIESKVVGVDGDAVLNTAHALHGVEPLPEASR
jgi:hypothetical protein